jgi:hypothetical protein
VISLIRTVTTGLEQKPAYPVVFKEEGWPIIAYVINATDGDDDDSLYTLAGVSAAKQLLEPIGRGKCIFHLSYFLPCMISLKYNMYSTFLNMIDRITVFCCPTVYALTVEIL